MKTKGSTANDAVLPKGDKMKTYVTRQNDPLIGSLAYGRAKRQIANVGCGLVAIYNIMSRLRCPQTVEEIIRDAQRLKMPWLFGIFGTKPKSLGRYFRQKKIPFEQTSDSAVFLKKLPAADAAIICTWNSKRTEGIHFFAVLNDNGSFSALNQYNADTPTAFSAEAVRRDRFITGYLFYRKA